MDKKFQHRKHMKQEEQIRSTPKLELNPPEKKQETENDKLNLPKHLHEKSPDKDIEGNK